MNCLVHLADGVTDSVPSILGDLAESRSCQPDTSSANGTRYFMPYDLLQLKSAAKSWLEIEIRPHHLGPMESTWFSRDSFIRFRMVSCWLEKL